VDAELEGHFGEFICYGSERFIVIDVDGDLEGMDKEFIISELNSSYPEEVIAIGEKLRGTGHE
jgi:hypothetical protein